MKLKLLVKEVVIVINKKQKGGLVIQPPDTSLMGENYPRPGALTLVQYNNSTLYGMQIPDNNDQLRLLQMYAYLMYTLEIKRIIDLHSCGTGLHPRPIYVGPGMSYEQCSKDGRVNGERKAWEYLKTLEITNNNDPLVHFIDNLQGVGIVDMTAGTPEIWRRIDNHFPYSILDPNGPKTVVHCQAGFGRTGSVFLYLICREHMNIAHISLELLGTGSSQELWNRLYNLLNQPELNHMQQELFMIDTVDKQNLFLSRINLIMCTLYHRLNMYGQDIWLYLVGYGLGNRNRPNTIFRNSVLGNFANNGDINYPMLIANNLLI